MLHPFLDVIVPEDVIVPDGEYLTSFNFPLVLLIILLILVLVLSFYFIRRTIKQSHVECAPEDSTAPIESDEAE